MGDKAKRARERKRVATRAETLARIGEAINTGELISNDNQQIYYSCNLMFEGSEHDEKCEGGCPRLSNWEVAIVYEKETIRDMGGNPDTIMPNPFVTEVTLHALIDYLIDDLKIITRDELELRMRQAMYKKLNSMRVNDLPGIIAEHRLQQARAKILGPNGRVQ